MILLSKISVPLDTEKPQLLFLTINGAVSAAVLYR